MLHIAIAYKFIFALLTYKSRYRQIAIFRYLLNILIGVIEAIEFRDYSFLYDYLRGAKVSHCCT